MKILVAGELRLEQSAAHHVRDVLRLEPGTAVEVFDDSGATARATIILCSSAAVLLQVEPFSTAAATTFKLTVAAAIPKASRADWMIEKLSELGVDRFIPLQTARSVVHPEGKNKLVRWERLAAEAAKQCRRRAVMRISPLLQLADVITLMTGPPATSASQPADGWYFSTAPEARPLRHLIDVPKPGHLMLLIGPEGGWVPEEIADFDAAGLTAVALTDTILRTETAALAAAAVVATLFSSDRSNP